MEYRKRAVNLGEHVWGQTLECLQCLPSPENWDWQKEKENGNWKPIGPLQQLLQPLSRTFEMRM